MLLLFAVVVVVFVVFVVVLVLVSKLMSTYLFTQAAIIMQQIFRCSVALFIISADRLLQSWQPTDQYSWADQVEGSL